MGSKGHVNKYSTQVSRKPNKKTKMTEKKSWVESSTTLLILNLNDLLYLMVTDEYSW